MTPKEKHNRTVRKRVAKLSSIFNRLNFKFDNSFQDKRRAQSIIYLLQCSGVKTGYKFTSMIRLYSRQLADDLQVLYSTKNKEKKKEAI